MVTIVVKEGASLKEFRMPRKLLTWHSSFFAAALDPEGNWASSGDNTFQIQDSIEVFEVFSCWIYTRKLRDPPARMITADKQKEQAPQDIYLDDLKLSKIWVFGDMRGIPALMNAAIDMLHERFTATWSTLEAGPISYVYDNTEEESKLRAFVVESWARTESLDSFLQADVGGVDGAFVMSVFEGLIHLHTCTYGSASVNRRKTQLSQETFSKLNRCKWHNHSGPGGKLRLEDRGCAD
jgi:hypothetical protein